MIISKKKVDIELDKANMADIVKAVEVLLEEFVSRGWTIVIPEIADNQKRFTITFHK